MTKMVDVDKLTDAELQTKLQEYGFPVMPITGTTRKVMTKKLKMLMENRNKLGSESSGRRSLGRYSSEEDSDTDVKSIKKDNRRVTMAAPIMQPPSSTLKSKKSSRFNETVEPEVKEIPVRKEVKTSTITSRTQKIMQTAQDEFDTGSESESDLVTNRYVTTRNSTSDFSRSSPVKPSLSSSYSRYTPPESTESSYSSTRNIPYNNSSPSRISSYNSPSLASEYAADRLNQIRSRLSLATGYDSPSSYSTLDKEETPFLSNFTKRLSTLSKPESDNDRYYKNDIIKEHDTNGSSLYARSQLGSLRVNRNRDSSYNRVNNQNNILKNNFVSFAVLGGAALFFVLLAIMYLGMKSDTSLAPAGSTIPHCLKGDNNMKKAINCIPEEEVSDALNLLHVLKPELQKRAVASRCFDPTIKAHMTESEIVNFCVTNYAIDNDAVIKRDLYNLEVMIFQNPEWGLSIVQTENNNGQVNVKDVAENMEQVVFNRDIKLTSLVIFQPDLPWKCSFYQTFHVLLKAATFIMLIFLALYSVNWMVKYYKHHIQKQKDEIGFMVERIIDVLQSSISENDTENFVVINHVRDMILPVKDRKKKERTWAKAVKFINENESRVRTEIQEVQGEPFEVWRWIGSANLSMSGDHSDYIYRKGRRIVDAEYLIMQVLKFPHKRLRFCKSSDVELKNEVREGLLSVFLLHCGSCKREHPICSEDPELELMNVNQAFVAGVVSLGMSLYHLNELCSSLHIPTISGKYYNIYLDELFEIYNQSLSESEKSRDDTWRKVKEEVSKSTEQKVEDEEPEEAFSGRVLRSSTPKISLEETSKFNLKVKNFLEELKKSPVEIEQLSKQTINQSDCYLWHNERKKRVTASNFGRIVKLLPSTDRSKIVEELLSSNFKGNIFTRHGKENEAQAIKDFEQVLGEAVTACGLFVHPEHPYLAASPDGLLGISSIVEIKCPYKAKDLTPQEAIERKLIQFGTLHDGIFSLKRNDKYYLQVQGQLFVTGRESCYFVVWTQHGLVYEKIYRDEKCWEDMFPKLKEFYFEHMLPRILKGF